MVEVKQISGGWGVVSGPGLLLDGETGAPVVFTRAEVEAAELEQLLPGLLGANPGKLLRVARAMDRPDLLREVGR